MEFKPDPYLLLHPNIPKPLHGLNPRSILGKDWWDMQRQRAYAAYNYHCWACGIHKQKAMFNKWLEAHECYEINYSEGTAKMIKIVALCHACHNYIHSGRLTALHDKGEINNAKYYQIMEHGKNLTDPLDPSKNPFILNDSGMAEWSEWHLIIDGKKYFSKFKDIYEWESYYNF